MQHVSTDSLGFITCSLCGCACGMNLLAQRQAGGQPLSITVLPSAAPGWGASGLCMRGWQMGEILGSRRRLRHPMQWDEGEQHRVEWDGAIARAGELLGRLQQSDPASIGIILGDSLANEEVFAARAFADAIGTPNIATLGLELDAPVIHGIEQVIGGPYRSPKPEELCDTDLFLCVNSNYQHINPRAAGAMTRLLQDGARMALIDEVDQGLAVWAEVYARHRPGMRAVALRQVAGALAGGDAAAGPLDAADVEAIVGMVAESRHVAIPFSAEAIVSTDEAFAIAQLARALEDGEHEVGMYLLPSGANTFGIIDMLAPGAAGSGGMGALEMMSHGSGIRCLIAIGEDLGRLFGPTDLATLRRRLELGISLSSFVSPTTNLADLALPVQMSGEREGTIRRPGGRLWWSQPLIPPAGQSRTIEATLEALGRPLGIEAVWSDPEVLWGRIRAEVPGYAHVELEALRRGEFPTVGPETPRVTEVVPAAVLTAPPVEVPRTSEERPWLLIPRSTRGGWTTDPRCQGAHILRREATQYREPYILLAPEEMKPLQVREGGRLQVVTAAGAAQVRVRGDRGVPPKIAILPTEFPGLLRTLAGAGEGMPEEPGLPASPVAGQVRPVETR
ncbi:MAG: molybdopterin-dependent oxidoreductase [candidate division WS1 bacterium]|nr:molybdopterin-dependent oxidoreductase [candidate division WS1 bacterium]